MVIIAINKLTNNIAITGPIEASAISPKPSSWLFLPERTAQIPSPNDIINGTDIAPVVTPRPICFALIPPTPVAAFPPDAADVV